MALVSPGVEVQVIDESFYTPAGAGTVPMIFIATAENKVTASGSGTAKGTLKANAGKPYLITSQRELGETFGDALFYSDSIGNMIHAGELNEYGLNTAYSLLGVSNRVYVCRADLDLAKLEAQSAAPGGEPRDGTYWFDTTASSFGILEWNGAAINVSGGQSFTSVEPIVIVDGSLVNSGNINGSVGGVGDYAVDATTSAYKLWYKSSGNGLDISSGTWVAVGSEEWAASWPTVRGKPTTAELAAGGNIDVNSFSVTIAPGGNLAAFAAAINADVGITGAGISAAVVEGYIEIYSRTAAVVIANSGFAGLANGTYAIPTVAVAPHTNVPTFKTADDNRPTGSIWLKTTQPNGGANFRVKRYNSDTQLWAPIFAPVYQSNAEAIYELNKTGGGAGLSIGDLYVRANVEGSSPKLGDWKVYTRNANGPTVIVGSKIAGGTLTPGAVSFSITETRTGSNKFYPRDADTDALTPVSISLTAAGDADDAKDLAASINAAGLVNVTASVDGLNRIVISHKLGGEFTLYDASGHLTEAGFAPYDYDQDTGTVNLAWQAGATNSDPEEMVATLWKPLLPTADNNEPLALTASGELWYSSVVDEIDIMIHDGSKWVGYLNFNHGDGTGQTDSEGPFVAASEPEEQRDGSDLETGDLWIDTADIENFPTIYKYNKTLGQWILVDKTDQTTENGVLFADARYGVDGGNYLTGLDAGAIDAMLSTNYVDPDAPDPALYPKGMLLWNLRRSGFNVKRFERNWIDVNAGPNPRYELDATMDTYYPHRWVTDSGNNEDGSGTFGRHAQRKSVAQALQAMVNSNQDIRDEDSRYFNLIACPGYPELIGEMITLNYDRRLTAFVVGDSPARLTPDATSLNEWASNVRLAVEDNDQGAVSYDEYMAMYYPWGFTSDNFGNNVVVPPSHMALRTIILNDQVAFPWFAPAGTRRGGVTNATASGYINSEGEFVSIALNTGQRDTLYSNNINPITFLSGAGLVVFGQKTRARNASALDRVNVARLIVYMRGQLEKLARPYLFEPNDKITRDQIKAAADAFCLELVSLRALYDYLVVCDESNNTPARIDRNELYLDIAIEPVKAVEFIYIPLRIKNTGEIAALG